MFFNESRIRNILVCKNCKNKLDEARTLPCISTICNNCTRLLKIENNKFKCIVCPRQHYIEDGGLPVNNLIQNLLEEEAIDVSRGRSFEKLKNKIEIIEKNFKEIHTCITSGSDYIKEHYTNLENEIQLSKEETIQAVEEYHYYLSNQIKLCREDHLLKNKNNKYDYNSFNVVLNDLKSFKEKSITYLVNNQVDDDLVDRYCLCHLRSNQLPSI